MSLRLLDLSNVTYYTFSDTFDWHTWNDKEWKTKGKSRDRFGVAGGQEMLNAQIDKRVVRVTGAYHAASQSGLENFIANLAEALHNNGDPFRFSWKSNWYINCSRVSAFKAERFPGALAFKSVNLSFDLECPDPFWYATAGDEDEVSVTSSPQSFVYTCNSNVPSPLSLTVIPGTGESWTALAVKNETDGDDNFTYTDSGLSAGVTLSIDAQNGNVTLDGENTIRYFTRSFLRVLPGSNTLTVTGGPGVSSTAITFSSPKREI